MPPNKQTQAFLDQAAGKPGLHELPVEAARAMFDAMAVLLGEPPVVAAVEDRHVPGPAGVVPIRIYRPRNDSFLPALICSMRTGSPSAASRATIRPVGPSPPRPTAVAVDYRRAPENNFPALAEGDAGVADVRVETHTGRGLGADAPIVSESGRRL